MLMDILFYFYFLIVGVVTAFLTKLHVKHFGKNWQRRYILPLGFLIVILSIILLSLVVPANIIVYFYSPIIAYYIGVTAHLSFRKITEYEQNKVNGNWKQ